MAATVSAKGAFHVCDTNTSARPTACASSGSSVYRAREYCVAGLTTRCTTCPGQGRSDRWSLVTVRVGDGVRRVEARIKSRRRGRRRHSLLAYTREG
eukprot:4900821-Pyramimonas_sp.AAC.1